MIYAILVLLSGLSISAVAAYYSIIGLTTIFSGSVLAVAVMGGVLEVGKLVAASWLKQNWKDVGLLMKSYLVAAVTILMFITSMGIFGYLSKAHLEQTSGISHNQSKIEQIEFNITQQEEKVERLQDNLKRSQAMVDQLDDALKVYVDNEYVTRALKERAKQKEERERLKQEQKEYESEIEDITQKIGVLNKKKFKYQQEVQEIEVEVGPIKYISDLVYGEEKSKDMLNDAVRAVILILIFVFDPLAVLLLLAANISFEKAFKKKKEKRNSKKLENSAKNLAEPESSMLVVKSTPQKEPTTTEDTNTIMPDKNSNENKTPITGSNFGNNDNNDKNTKIEMKKTFDKNWTDTSKKSKEEKRIADLQRSFDEVDETEQPANDNKKHKLLEKKRKAIDWQDKLLNESEHVSMLTKEDMLKSVEKSFGQAIERANIPFNLNSPEGEELKKIIVNNLQKEYK